MTPTCQNVAKKMFDVELALYVLHVLIWGLSRYFGFLPLSKLMHIRLIGDFKLLLGVSVSV